MDILGVVTVPGWVLTIIIIIITLYLYSLWHHSLWRRNGIPGPKPTPFLGVLPLIKKHGLAKADLELVTKYGSVVGVYNGLLPVLLVTDPAMIKEIFIKEFSNFTNRPIPFKMDKEMASGVGAAFDNHWKFLRSTLSPTFSSGKQKLMVPKIHRCCTDLVANIQKQREQGHVDMKEVCGAYTMDVIASTAFGIEVNSQKDPNNQFVKHAKEAALGEIFKLKFLLIMLFPFLKNLVTVQLSSKAVNDFFKTVVDSAIELRKTGHEVYNDFLQLMLNARHDDTQSEYFTKGDVQEFKNRGLNSMELKENAVTFFIAGYDTTANTLSFACYCLATNQGVQGKCIDEIENVIKGGTPQMEDLVELEYLDRFFNEVLRLYGAASRFHRAAREDVTVSGVHIPKDVNVSVPIYALHRNPKYWPDPEKFDPDRFTDENKAKRPEYTFVPFGVGPRICIGMRLALMEAKMALVFMLQRFTFSPCSETEIPVELEQGAIIRAKNGIKLNIINR
ncbi:cytochrome P450 3A41-like isoform X2 [Mytilus trossulus]|uniref:cytochrome P450 3A41-like isoform X2 n=1 Tax=Mytilus trossulus TaxID=6551 RepID=UPI003007D09E